MVRAGKIKHPREWKQSGYNEIQNPPKRYQIIDRNRLCELTGVKEINRLGVEHAAWIENALTNETSKRDDK